VDRLAFVVDRLLFGALILGFACLFDLGRLGGDRLSHALRRSTIGAGGFHVRVRDGIGCLTSAVATKPSKIKGGQDQRGPILKGARDQRVLFEVCFAGALLGALLGFVLAQAAFYLLLIVARRSFSAARKAGCDGE
jgi:hypothetical protein